MKPEISTIYRNKTFGCSNILIGTICYRYQRLWVQALPIRRQTPALSIRAPRPAAARKKIRLAHRRNPLFRTRVTMQGVVRSLRRICKVFMQRFVHGYVSLDLIVGYECFCFLIAFVVLHNRREERGLTRN
jgi:hypothetical protein